MPIGIGATGWSADRSFLASTQHNREMRRCGPGGGGGRETRGESGHEQRPGNPQGDVEQPTSSNTPGTHLAQPCQTSAAPMARFLIGALVRGGDDLYPSRCPFGPMKFNVPPTPAPSISHISDAENHTRNFKRLVGAKAIRVTGHVPSRILRAAAVALPQEFPTPNRLAIDDPGVYVGQRIGCPDSTRSGSPECRIWVGSASSWPSDAAVQPGSFAGRWWPPANDRCLRR